MCAFWNKLKSDNHTKTNSKLRSNDFADFYSSTMSDNNNLTEEQLEICKNVKDKASALTCTCKTTRDSTLDNMAEDPIKSEICSSCGHIGKQINLTTPDSCLSEQSVKNAIKSLKKSPSSRCDGITVNHLFHAKYMNNNDTPIYICSLDAHKCFDSIWHGGLFYKLAGKIPDLHWVFLYKWYMSSKAHARWAGELSCFIQYLKRHEAMKYYITQTIQYLHKCPSFISQIE
ncbi:unnamed protein product [Meganyctiphanes norvegica]|uniref:Reverse transcriptase domain-containing protein n=1 Tax=Meganyctiphanes norvegica TaxID=48144 RepID=A0AAV2QIH5_MEGNR